MNEDEAPIIYKVQFYTSSTVLSSGSAKLKGIKNIDYYRDGGLIKYTTGEFSTEKEAEKKLREVRKSFPDAFIIKTRDGKRVK